jgi:hypothetical protein
MDSTRPPLPRILPIGPDPVRLHADEQADDAVRFDLAASRDAVVVGLDHAAVWAQCLARLEDPRDACG